MWDWVNDPFQKIYSFKLQIKLKLAWGVLQQQGLKGVI